MGPDELHALGLYDPAATDAALRLALLELALAQGATVDDIRDAIAAGHLHVLGAECIMRGARERLTLSEVASRAEITEDDALAVWRSWGFPDPLPGAQRFTDADVDALQTLRGIAGVTGREPAIAFARTIGESSSKIAEATVSLLRSRVEVSLIEGSGNALELASTLIFLSRELLPRVAREIDTVLRHHLAVVGRRYSLSGGPASSTNVVRLVVGFADIVGYTALSTSLESGELRNLMVRFEADSADCIARHGATLVKRIGDAVMFVTPRPEAAAAVALDLVETGRERVELHVALAAGDVVARDGDFYGSPVNLASRLTDVAPPGVVLITAELAGQLGDVAGLSIAPWGSRALAGFTDAVEISMLKRPR